MTNDEQFRKALLSDEVIVDIEALSQLFGEIEERNNNIDVSVYCILSALSVFSIQNGIRGDVFEVFLKRCLAAYHQTSVDLRVACARAPGHA